MRIGLFDSGIGGLTVLKTLLQKYPNNEYIYYGDTLNVPYGNKNKSQLLKLAIDNISFLQEFNIDIIIIACGTISANCLDELKQVVSIPIYDIITPTIEYLNNSNYKHIGIIATKATIDSHIFKLKINKSVYEIATPELVPIIENNQNNKLNSILNRYLNNYQNIFDALVLGCTHYPIIKDYIKNNLSNNIAIIDMSNFLTITDGNNKQVDIYFSKLNNHIIKNTKRILQNEKYTIKERKKVCK